MIRDPTNTPAVPGGLPFDATQIQFTQSGTGAVARTVQDKLRDIVALADFATLGHYNTAVAALGNAGNYSFGGTINLPGAGQSCGITWNTSDIHLFRQGAGRLAIQLGAASGNDTAIDITNVNTVEEGSTRLRIWAYDLNAITNQSFLEIRNVRDVGTESMQYNSESQGSGTIRDQVWLFGGVEAMRLNTSKNLSIQGTLSVVSAVTSTFGGNINVSGNVNLSGASSLIAFAPAASKIIAGATSLALRNAADSANNVLVVDAGIVTLRNKIFPGTDGAAAQSASGLYAGTGVPNNANGANGDIYFRSDGGAGTTIYQRRAGTWVATGA